MTKVDNILTPDKGKALYRKRDGFGPIYGVKLGFVKNEQGIIVPDNENNYNEKEETQQTNENNQ